MTKTPKKKNFTKKNPALAGYSFSQMEEPLDGQTSIDVGAPLEPLTESISSGSEELLGRIKENANKQTKSERLVLLLKPDIKRAIQERASFYGLSMNALVGLVLKDYIDREKEAAKELP